MKWQHEIQFEIIFGEILYNGSSKQHNTFSLDFWKTMIGH